MTKSKIPEVNNMLKNNNLLLETTLKSIGYALIAADKKGNITFINSIAENLTGWKKKDVIGNNSEEVFCLIDSKTGKKIDFPIKKVLQENITINSNNNNISIKSKNNKKYPVEYLCTAIIDDKNNIHGAVLLFNNITSNIKMNEAILKTQKMESINTLAGGIAHDFNNLLATILGNLSIVKMDAVPGDETYESLIEMEKATLKAKDLANKLLTFSKGSEPVKKSISIKNLIKDITKYSLKDTNTQNQFNIDDNLMPVEINEDQITHVIENIIINAIQTMQNRGIIIISATNVDIEEGNDLQLVNGKYIKISIKDQGKGIHENHIPKIFDPYFTTKQGQCGLGLAISYSIIKKHKGEITFDTKYEEGTTFNIYLPASTNEKIIPQKADKKVITGEGEILVMDDDVMVQKSAGRILKRLGYQVTFTKDGAETIKAYKKAKKDNKPFDAVIMDLTIPGGMGGKEAINELKKIDSEIKVVISSGYSNDPAVTSPRKFGFKGVIPKPYTIQEMGKILHNILQ